MKELRIAGNAILTSKRIIVAGHINPDGDCIGSLLALGQGLRQLGKIVTMVSPGGVPMRYRGLPGANEIVRRITDSAPDLAIAVDCSARELLGSAVGIFEKSKSILEIDHHDIRSSFGDVQFIEPRAASVGEMVYEILTYLDAEITKEIAENIFTSIVVETSSFSLPNIRPLTFEICAQLLKRGVDFPKLSEMVYWSKPRKVSVLIGFCLSKCRFLHNGKIAVSMLRKKDLKKLQARYEDADSVAGELLTVKGVAIVLFFRESSKGYLRVSLRSKYGADVASLAQSYGGGGHFDAAGCRLANTAKMKHRLIDGALMLLKKNYKRMAI